MINNDNNQLDQDSLKESKKVETPDEEPSIAVQGFLKIFDPESGEVLTHGRA